MNSAFMLAAVPETCRDTIYRKMDALNNAVVRLPVPIALEKLELHVIEGIDVRKSIADGARQRRIALERSLCFENREQRVKRVPPFGVQAREDRLAQLAILDEILITRCDGDVALREYHIHVG